MVNPISLDIERELKRTEEANEGAAASGAQPSVATALNGGVDPLALAVYLLMEVSNTTAQCAMIHTKGLQQNALAQQDLDDQAAKMQWNGLPQLQINHHQHQTIAKTHWTWKFWQHSGMFLYVTFQKIASFDTHPNEGLVDQAEAKNQQISGDRTAITQQLNVLQQRAQTGETNVSSFTDESMQAIQEESNLISILQTLTFKALLRQPPQ